MTKVTKDRGGTATRGKHEDDLQRDDRGAGHVPKKSKKDLDNELDKGLVPLVGSAGDLTTEQDGAGRRSQGQALSRPGQGRSRSP
jgi:hypothetical protein